MHLTHQGGLVEVLFRGGHVQGRVLVEEVDRFQADLEDLARHDGEVFDAGDVVDAELDPDDNVLVLDAVPAGRETSDPRASPRLVRVPASRVQLPVPVGGDVDVVVGELGPLEVERGRVGEHLLEGGRVDLVRHRLPVHRVAHLGVLDLEDPVGVGVQVQAAGGLDHGLGDAVGHPVGVPLRVDGHRVGLVVRQSVPVALEHGVDAQREDVLVVDRQHARVHHGAKGDAGPVELVVDGLGRQDARGPDLIGDLAGLVEHEGQDVLVVGHGDDALQDQLAVADHGRPARAVVGVLPADARVLLVHAHAVLDRGGGALVVGDDGRDVLDVAQAVAAELEVVGHGAGAGVPQVVRRLLVVGVPGVGVGDVHVGQRQAVEQRAGVVAHVVQHHALPLVEAHAERPLLPLQGLARLAGRGHLERRSFGLDDPEGLDVLPKVRLGL